MKLYTTNLLHTNDHPRKIYLELRMLIYHANNHDPYMEKLGFYLQFHSKTAEVYQNWLAS